MMALDCVVVVLVPVGLGEIALRTTPEEAADDDAAPPYAEVDKPLTKRCCVGLWGREETAPRCTNGLLPPADGEAPYREPKEDVTVEGWGWGPGELGRLPRAAGVI